MQVARQKSFSGAARALGISKAQCSKLVATLERTLGTLLLERTTRRVRLTLAGASYLSDILQVLEDLEAAKDRATQGGAPVRERIRIAAPACVSALFLGPIIERLMQSDAALAWRLVAHDPWSPVTARTLDCAIVFNGDDVPGAVVLREDVLPVVLAARADYLSLRGTPAHPGDLNAHPCFLQGGLVHGSTLRFTGPDGAEGTQKIEPVLVTGDGRLVRDAALVGQGIALLPEYLVKAEVAANRLVRVLPEYGFSPVRIRLLGFSGSLEQPDVRSFLDLVEGLEIWGGHGEGRPGPQVATA